MNLGPFSFSTTGPITLSLGPFAFSTTTPDNPTISLNGSSLVLIDKDQVFTDAGATAVDGVGTDISGDIVVTGSVDTSTLGVYYLYYDVTDINGQDATQVVRTVVVTTVNVGSSIRLQGLGTNLTLRL